MSSSGSISTPEAISSSGSMSSARIWLFRVLTLAGAAALVYTWLQPWWIAYIEALLENGVVIYPHAMVISGTLRGYPEWIIGAEMPSWFFPAMWAYLGICVGVLFYSTFLTDEDRITLGKIDLSMPKALIGFAGLAFILFVVVFPIVITIRAPEFYGTPLQGSVFVSMNEHTESYVITSLQPAYWITCAIGPYLVALALLRSKIVGKSDLNAE